MDLPRDLDPRHDDQFSLQRAYFIPFTGNTAQEAVNAMIAAYGYRKTLTHLSVFPGGALMVIFSPTR